MTDTEMLKSKILASGYKWLAGANACGLTYAGLWKKVHNATEFKASEIAALKKLLRLTDAERDAIFFAVVVD